MNSRILSISIDRDPQEVYDFVADPRTLPQWAHGLGKSVKNVGGAWVVSTPTGDARVRFAPRNEFGILDHYLQLATGAEVYVPMRVVADRDESLVIFTLFQQPGMSDADFARDIAIVERDLKALKKVLETVESA